MFFYCLISGTTFQITGLLKNSYSLYPILWGSDNICIRKKKKFGGKKLAGAPVYGALAFLGGSLCKNGKWWGLGKNGRKLGFILHKSWR